MYIFWIFKVLEFHIFEIVNVFLVCLIGYYDVIFFTINLFLLYESFWKSFVEMSFFYDIISHLTPFVAPLIVFWPTTTTSY